MSQFKKNYFGSADPDAASLLHLNCLDTNEPWHTQILVLAVEAPKSPHGKSSRTCIFANHCRLIGFDIVINGNFQQDHLCTVQLQAVIHDHLLFEM